jgi:hypothetical protein
MTLSTTRSDFDRFTTGISSYRRLKRSQTNSLTRTLHIFWNASESIRYFKTRETHATLRITTFDTLWTCFAPKTKIIAKPFMNTPQILKVATPIPYTKEPEPVLNILCWGVSLSSVLYTFISIFQNSNQNMSLLILHENHVHSNLG